MLFLSSTAGGKPCPLTQYPLNPVDDLAPSFRFRLTSALLAHKDPVVASLDGEKRISASADIYLGGAVPFGYRVGNSGERSRRARGGRDRSVID
jgi:hypothetical protein